MQNILFTLGYSQYSETYFRYAQVIAKQFGAKLSILHVFDQPEATLIPEGRLSTDSYLKSILHDDQHKSAWQVKEINRLTRFANEMKSDEFKASDVELIVKGGNIVTEIDNAMKSGKYDLLIMGMRKHGLSERIFGSITKQVMNVIDVPLLLIPPSAIFSTIAKIVYATTFELQHVVDLQNIIKWRNVFDASLKVVYVDEQDDPTEASRKLNRLLSNANITLDHKVSSKILIGSVEDALNDYIKFSDADLLALHRKNRGFWSELRSGSITKEFISKMSIPILIFKTTPHIT